MTVFNKNLLKSELVLKDISFSALADILHINKATVSKKVNGVSEWTLGEIQTIGKTIGMNKIIEIFFAEKVS